MTVTEESIVVLLFLTMLMWGIYDTFYNNK